MNLEHFAPNDIDEDYRQGWYEGESVIDAHGLATAVESLPYLDPEEPQAYNDGVRHAIQAHVAWHN